MRILKRLKPSLKEKNDSWHEFVNCICDLLQNEKVQKMKQFRHHRDTNCFEHCLSVSYYSFLICKGLGLDYVSAARGGLLHDLFLYDWRTYHTGKERLWEKHAFIHPYKALENAKVFNLNEVEKDIIEKHMWPLTLKPPRYVESIIVCVVDKLCALVELSSKSVAYPFPGCNEPTG